MFQCFSTGELVSRRDLKNFHGSHEVAFNIIVNLRNRTGEKRRRQTLCDKRDYNFGWKNFPPNFTFLCTDLFLRDQKTLMIREDHDKTRN